MTRTDSLRSLALGVLLMAMASAVMALTIDCPGDVGASVPAGNVAIHDDLSTAVHFLGGQLLTVSDNGGSGIVSLTHDGVTGDDTAHWGTTTGAGHIPYVNGTVLTVQPAAAVLGGQWGFDILWFDGGGGYLGQTNFQGLTGLVSLQSYVVTGAPAGTAGWFIQFRVFDSGGGQPAGSYGFSFDAIDVRPCAVSGLALGTPTVTGATGSVTTGNDAPDYFPLGVTNVTWTATDDLTTVDCVQVVTVTDVMPPTIGCPADVNVAAPTTYGSIYDPQHDFDHSIAGTLLTAADNGGSGLVSLTHDGVAGDATYHWGSGMGSGRIPYVDGATLTVQLGATIGNGQWGLDVLWFDAAEAYLGQTTLQSATASTAAADFVLTGAPAGTTLWFAQFRVFDQFGGQPAGGYGVELDSIRVEACGLQSLALGQPTVADNCGVATVTNDAPATFTGTTSVTWTATDDSGNQAGCVQAITVADSLAPTINCPPDLTIAATAVQSIVDPLNDLSHEIPGQALTLSDNGGSGIVSLTHDGVSGDATFHWGSGSGSGIITYIDGALLMVQPAAAIAGGQWGLTVLWFDSSDVYVGFGELQPATATTATQSYAITGAPAGAAGWHLQFRVFDAAGNQPAGSYGFSFDYVAVQACGATAVDLGEAGATDNCGPATSHDAPATLLPGTTAVTWTATDQAGNSSTCQQQVTVTAQTCADLQDAVAAIVCAAGSATTSLDALLNTISSALDDVFAIQTPCDVEASVCRATLAQLFATAAGTALP